MRERKRRSVGCPGNHRGSFSGEASRGAGGGAPAHLLRPGSERTLTTLEARHSRRRAASPPERQEPPLHRRPSRPTLPLLRFLSRALCPTGKGASVEEGF